MVNNDTRFWYLARSKADGLVAYLVSAVSESKAKESFGCLWDNYQWKKLTYAELNKIFNCGKPVEAVWDNFAIGDILFKIRNEGLVLRIAD